jgi:SPP1 family predicted phage head-tail adaptor
VTGVPSIRDLRTRVALETMAEAAAIDGAFVASWTLVATVWAEVVQPTGGLMVADRQVVDQATHRVRIRWRSDTATIRSVRLVQAGVRLAVRSVRDLDQSRRFQELLCSAEASGV